MMPVNKIGSKSPSRSSLLQLCSDMKRQAQSELPSIHSKKTIKKESLDFKTQRPDPSDKSALRLLDTPPNSKMEAYFAGNITECPYGITGTNMKCGYIAKSFQNLETHVSHKHTHLWDHFMRSTDKPYECTVCHWRYGALQQLKKHKMKYSKICGAFPQTLTEEFLSKVGRDVLFLESEGESTNNPLKGFIIDDVIRADETKCPYKGYFHCKYNFKGNLMLERHINQYHPDKYNEFMT